MGKNLLKLFLLVAAAWGFSSCATQETPAENRQVFGEPESTIPWNNPQRWEGQAGGFNAMRGQENY